MEISNIIALAALIISFLTFRKTIIDSRRNTRRAVEDKLELVSVMNNDLEFQNKQLLRIARKALIELKTLRKKNIKHQQITIKIENVITETEALISDIKTLIPLIGNLESDTFESTKSKLIRVDRMKKQLIHNNKLFDDIYETIISMSQ